MSDILKQAIKEIYSTIPETQKLNDDLMFGLVSFKFFYNDGKLDKADFKNSYTDGQNDGGIDLIAIEETDLEKNLILIQSKNIKDVNSKDEIKDIFTKMAQTVKDFKSEKISNYNEKLRRIFREKYDDSNDDSNFNIKLVLFLGFDKDEEYRNRIYAYLTRVDELLDYDCQIFFNKEIEQQIEYYNDTKKFVSNGKIKYYNEQGKIQYGENGILVNISANSLRKLYDMYKNHGLFEQNFRYFVKNEKIDGQINDSLSNKRDMFWFLNNGIIIGCKDFSIDGDNIKLIDFSIVNGCQTTTNLGKYKGKNEEYDFPIPCKIIKPHKTGEDNFNSFISEIAESSNSQKPISDRDLKSNLPEQRTLQKLLKSSDPKIYLEIKRGEGILQGKKVEFWQKIKNDQFGQLILATILQQPGTARSSKKKIFSDKSTYNKVFKRKQDKDTIVDLLKLSDLYEQFISKTNLSEKSLNVSKNGKYTILAIICFLIKNKRKLININKDCSSSEWSSNISEDNLEGLIFNPNRPDDFEKILNSLFGQIIRTLTVLYDSREGLETSVTNFFKTDKKYQSIILERIKDEYISDEYEYERLNDKLKLVFL